ncbi:hypothetical protein ACFWDI_07020 [Streptomyces sp. NPDC060064]|uniref:hypothetical protein n=1 Tax=Streptomyces sp. NPDC060064 TaxID=3347049 RepID=UPI0036976516
MSARSAAHSAKLRAGRPVTFSTVSTAVRPAAGVFPNGESDCRDGADGALVDHGAEPAGERRLEGTQ